MCSVISFLLMICQKVSVKVKFCRDFLRLNLVKHIVQFVLSCLPKIQHEHKHVDNKQSISFN